VRPARPADAERIARIHNQGIEERAATFQTKAQGQAEVAARIEGGDQLLVAEREGRIVGWAGVGRYDAHDYYAGIGEATLYVEGSARRAGAGRALLNALARQARPRGYHKLVGKIFTSNGASIALVRSCDWREVGVHRRHGKLDGEWKDVLVVERLLGEARETDLGGLRHDIRAPNDPPP
jgi:phosphinothricin acetyltransferase